MTAPGPAFDAELRTRAPDLGCRAERADDRAFLADLFVACSPLTGLLPDAMVREQAAIQHDAHAGAWPGAMRRIVTIGGEPVGRLVIGWGAIGWGADATRCIDVALLPAHQGRGIGARLLAAWLAVADARGLAAGLQVRADNPAARLYARLGFVPDPATAHQPFVTMDRAARTEARGAG